MYIDFIFKVFNENKNKYSIVWKDKYYTYEDLSNKIKHYSNFILDRGIKTGDVVGLDGEYSPNTIALLISLIDLKTIIVPFVNSNPKENKRKIEIINLEKIIHVDENDNVKFEDLNTTANHEFLTFLRKEVHPGLILFTSGTSGFPKAAVHDFSKLLKKFEIKRTSLKTINFLSFDHWGGLNTLLHTLSNGGLVLTIKDRSPDAICSFIEKHKIELLPTSPTFLNLLILSNAYKNYNLGSLQRITYGTEPMLQSTLSKLKEIFPEIKLQQTYGLIELGVLRSKSKSDNSLWVKLGGEGYDIRIVDSILQIKAESAMLGYINAKSPFTEDGYYITGDLVEVEGEYVKILGRASELINVGGEKVYPSEIENVILQMDNVADVLVYGESNPIIGKIVAAKVKLINIENSKDFAKNLKKFCRERLENFKVPVKIAIVNNDMEFHGERFKKQRNLHS